MSERRKNLINKLREENIEAKFVEVEKNNRIIRSGLSVRKPEQALAATVYCEENESDEDLYKRIKEIIEMDQPEIDISKITDYKKASQKFMLKISTNPVKDLAKMHAFCDMFMTIAIKIDEQMSVGVTNDMLKTWGVTLTRAFNDAIESSEKNAPVEYRSLNDVITELDPDLVNEECRLKVLTNKDRVYGASAIIYSDVVEKLESMRQNFVLLPSSVHEVLIMPEDNFKPSEMKEITAMVKTINESMVSPEEILASHAYAFRDSTWYIIDEEGNMVR